MGFALSTVERFLKVIGDGSRLRILQALEQGELSVSEILEKTALPQTLVSFHLRVLRQAGVLATERRGPFIFYRLRDESLPNLLEACGRYAELLEEANPAEFEGPFWPKMRQITQTQRRTR